MRQVFTIGEADVAEIKAITQGSVIETDYKAKYIDAYCWDLVQPKHADIFVPTSAGERKRSGGIGWYLTTLISFLMV